MKNRSPERWVLIDYTNYRGERKTYLIEPTGQYWGRTDFHPEDQWLVSAIDVSRGVYRVFAAKDIHSWTPAKNAELHAFAMQANPPYTGPQP